MYLIENKTKFTHVTMSSWGIGVYRKTDGNAIIIEFENAGLKKFTIEAVNSMLVPLKEKASVDFLPTSVGKRESGSASLTASGPNGALIQFDGEASDFAGKNVIESFECNDSIIFNESYMIVGERTKAVKIHAMYDLTILGDVTVQECVVNGSLTIIGDARIESLTCYNTLVCEGNLHSKKIYVGQNIIVGSIDCDDIICDGNVILQATANINHSAKIEKTMVACEGIMGAGTFSATNAIANEYFEFEGEYEGKILELETDATISDSTPCKSSPCETLEEIINIANQKLAEEYSKCADYDENEITDLLKKFAASQGHELSTLPLAAPLFSRLIEISYQNRIETVDEFLTALIAKRTLPDSLCNYESIDHVGKLYLPKALSEIDELAFSPCTIEQFSKALAMAVKYKEALSEEWEILMDKIFESIGLKYSTVNSMINRNAPDNSHEGNKTEPTPTLSVPRMKKTDYLANKLSHSGKKLGLTDVELERMATIKVRTFGDLVQASDTDLVKAFGKKAFLANHLIQTRDKIIEKMTDME